MPRATTSSTIAALTLAAALAAGCGSDDKKTTSTAAAPIRPAGKATPTDLKIVRLVQQTGGRLHLDAIRLFGDRTLLDDKAALHTVAAARLKVATQLERDAKDASAKLESLGEKATVGTQVATAGKTAFDELASCGHEAAAFFRRASAGDAGALGRPDAACKSARLAYGQATTVADAIKAPRATGGAAPG
jgi:hypothetical protein